MKIQSRLLLLTSAMAVLVMTVALTVSSHLVSNALESAAKSKLSAVLEDRHSAILRRFERTQAELRVMGASRCVLTDLPALSAGFAQLGNNAQVLLQQSYLASEDTDASTSHAEILATPYGQANSHAMPNFRYTLKTYGWADILLIDPQGNVVFSVLKRADFATNLLTGPWKDTGLARAVTPLLRNAVPEARGFADYERYAPHNNTPASFLAIPVFDPDKHQFLGVVAVQLPNDQFNMVTHNLTGMGESGEVFVVGKNGWMLSDSRFSKESTAFNKQIDTEVSHRVLAGKSGLWTAPDYRGIEITAAFKPLNPFPGALGDQPRWGVIAKINQAEILADFDRLRQTLLLIGSVLVLLALLGGYWGARGITRPLLGIRDALSKLADGEIADVPGLQRRDEIGEMAKAAESFRKMTQQVGQDHWLAENVLSLTNAVSAETRVDKAAEQVLRLLCEQLGAPVGAIYLANQGRFQRVSAHGLARRSQSEDSFAAGDGVLGQCAKDGQAIVLSPVPSGLMIISTGLAEFPPHELVLYPLSHKNDVLAVVELATPRSLDPGQHALLKAATDALGLHFANLQAAEHNLELLDETRKQSTALKEQQESLLRSNEEMRAMSEELRSQSEEMKAQNEELKANQEEMRAQQEEVQHKNQVLESQSQQLQALITESNSKAEALGKANQYKSEFLANMSHELRTPLNSVLILSKNLTENEQQNLTPDQIESATVISESGAQLLTLINDILDLSKIEAGKLELQKETFLLDDLVTYLRRVFSPQAEKKHIAFNIEVDADLPATLHSDRQRLIQVLTNLLSNAIKFTDNGAVKLAIRKLDNDIQFEVFDSGIGIPTDKLEHIFGAFQQVDGSTSRKYGGSGLGLAISRHLARLLGGDIAVESQPGKGSRFAIRLINAYASPNLVERALAAPAYLKAQPTTPAAVVSEPVETSPAQHILVVEDDVRLLAILGKMIKALGFTPLCVESAEQAADAIAQATPAGILLDLGLPKMSGMELLRTLRAEAATARIPVFIMSGATDTGEARTLGALGFLKKPVSRDSISAAIRAMIAANVPVVEKRALLVDANREDVALIKQLFKQDAVEFVVGSTGAEALQLLQDSHFDTVILDLDLPDMSGNAWLKKVCSKRNPPPVIVFSARELSEEQVFELKEIAESIINKSMLNDRLREEVLHALHNVNTAIAAPLPLNKPGAGKKLLLVDDDARNLFALTKVLRARAFAIDVAADGAKALEMLPTGNYDALLTDIMMPEIDGYELIRRIRGLGYDDIPIIAITAKAMQGDEDLCMQAGASAYLAKPVDIDALLRLLKDLGV